MSTQREKSLGRHKGITHYTIGQRKGLNLSMGHPVFVTKICPETNEVVIGDNEEIFQREVRANRLNFMAAKLSKIGDSMRARPRYGTIMQERPAPSPLRGRMKSFVPLTSR